MQHPLGGVSAIDRSGRLVRHLAVVVGLLASIMAIAIASPPTPAQAVQPGAHAGTVVRDTPLRNTPHVLDGYVAAFAELGDLVVVGGNFTTVRTASSTTQIPRNHIFAFRKSTGAITSLNPGLNGEVTSILPTGDGNTVWVAGGFSSVNGQTVRMIVKLDATTGQRIGQFNPPAFNGRIHDIALRGDRLYVMGRFTMVGNQEHTLLAAVNPTTGAVDPAVDINFADPRRNGTLSILDADVTPDGTRLVAVGNFTKISGQTRYQIGMIDLTTTPVSVANWTTNQYGDGCSGSFQSYMRDIEISPDGKYFVVVTTGAYSSTFLCDTAARWEIEATGSNLQPTWVSYTGGDTLTAVAVTDTAVYLGGHQRADNNNYVADRIGPGAVQRTGLGAADPRSGAPLNWNPGRTRGYGVYGFLSTDEGLWIGSDTDRISGFQYRGRMAFMPTSGGTPMPSEYVGDLPGTVHLLGPTTGSGADLDRVITRSFDGSTVTSNTAAAGTRSWRESRGAFMVEGVLYTGWSDRTFSKQTFDGTTFGPVEAVPLQRIDSSVSWGNTNGSASLNRYSTEDLSTVTGTFYDPTHGRVYFTRSGQSSLFYRHFSTESDVFGAARLTSVGNITGLNWSNVRGMFIADGKLFTGDASTGNLTRWTWDTAAGRPVVGSNVVVSGPAIDGLDWRARDIFVYASDSSEAPNEPPAAAAATATCEAATCDFDGSDSSDPDGSIASYSWDFGDGTSNATGRNPTHVYATSGTFTVTLTVTDNRGATDSTQIQVQVTVANAPPTASFTPVCDGLTCSVDASTSGDPDGTIESYAWDFGDGTTGTGVITDHTYGAAGTYTIRLTVTDDRGGENSRTEQVSVIDPDATPTVNFGAAGGTNVNSTTPTVTIPGSVEADDVLVLLATLNSSNPTVTGPPGWTLVDSGNNATVTAQTFMWTKKAGPNDAGSNARLTLSAAAKTSLQVLSYRGADSVSAHDFAFDTVSRVERTTPTVQVDTAGSRLVSYWATKSNDITGWDLPAGVELRNETASTGNGRVVAAVADSGPLGAGPAGGFTATASPANRRGIVWSIVVAPDTSAPNVPPTARFDTSCSGLTCSMDASASEDPDGTIASYDWEYGDGVSGTGATTSHTYESDGTYTVSLTVTDDDGASSTTTRELTASSAPTRPASFRAAAGVNVNSTTPTVQVPGSVEAGDQLVLIATVNSLTPTVSGPAGWTLIDSGSDGTATAQTFAWKKQAVAGDGGSNARVTLSSISKTSLQVLAYEDASGVSAHAVAFDTVSRADRTTPTVPIDRVGSVLISYWADKSSSTTTWTLPNGAQLRDERAGSGSGRIVAAAADSGSLPVGTGGGLTATADSSNRRGIVWSIVVAPAS